jgi:pentatricopeptide repeat protein
MNVDEQIKEYATQLNEKITPRQKKRILQKLGKLKKCLSSPGATDSNPIKKSRQENGVKDISESEHLETDRDRNHSITHKEKKTFLHLLNKDLSSFALKKQADKARLAVKQALKKGVELDVLTYTNLINVFIRCGDISRAQLTLQEMQSKDIFPNIVTYTTILKGYCEYGLMKEATQLFQQLTTQKQQSQQQTLSSLGVFYNLRTISTYLRGCLRTGLVDHALSCIDIIQTIFHHSQQQQSMKNETVSDKEIIQYITCYETIISLLCQSGHLIKAKELLQHFLQFSKQLSAMKLQSNNSNNNSLFTQDIKVGSASIYTYLARSSLLLGQWEDVSQYIILAEEALQQEDNASLNQAMKRKFIQVIHETAAEEVAEEETERKNKNYINNHILDDEDDNQNDIEHNKSLKLFQQHRRQELHKIIEELQDYLVNIQTMIHPLQHHHNLHHSYTIQIPQLTNLLPSISSLVTRENTSSSSVAPPQGSGSSSTSNNSNSLSSIAAIIVYYCILSKVYYFGFDGQGDSLPLISDIHTTTNTANTTDSNTTLDTTNDDSSFADKHYSILSANQTKFGLATKRIRQLLLSNNNNNNNIYPRHILLPFLKSMEEKQWEKLSSCLSNETGLLSLSKLFYDYQQTEEEINHWKATGMFSTLPLKLEIGSGNGDWITAQAEADRIFSTTTTTTTTTTNNHRKSPHNNMIVKAHWIAIELRCDRIYHILYHHLLRLRGLLLFQDPNYEQRLHTLNNLSILGGDASHILQSHLPPNALSAVFINYPQPPERIHGVGVSSTTNSNNNNSNNNNNNNHHHHKNQGKHLLTTEFFQLLLTHNLQDQGTLTILTDNLAYAEQLADSLIHISEDIFSSISPTSLQQWHLQQQQQQQQDQLETQELSLAEERQQRKRLLKLQNKYFYMDAMNTNTTTTTTTVTIAEDIIPSTWRLQREHTYSSLQHQRSLTIWRGEPGEVAGHTVHATSYFDRMWSLGEKKRRWFVFVKKENIINVLHLFSTLTTTVSTTATTTYTNQTTSNDHVNDFRGNNQSTLMGDALDDNDDHIPKELDMKKKDMKKKKQQSKKRANNSDYVMNYDVDY